MKSSAGRASNGAPDPPARASSGAAAAHSWTGPWEPSWNGGASTPVSPSGPPALSWLRRGPSGRSTTTTSTRARTSSRAIRSGRPAGAFARPGSRPLRRTDVTGRHACAAIDRRTPGGTQCFLPAPWPRWKTATGPTLSRPTMHCARSTARTRGGLRKREPIFSFWKPWEPCAKPSPLREAARDTGIEIHRQLPLQRGGIALRRRTPPGGGAARHGTRTLRRCRSTAVPREIMERNVTLLLSALGEISRAEGTSLSASTQMSGRRGTNGQGACTGVVAPAAYADLALSWIRAGASFIGGCCGTTPEYIRSVRRAIG